jgi:hypothetical protein
MRLYVNPTKHGAEDTTFYRGTIPTTALAYLFWYDIIANESQTLVLPDEIPSTHSAILVVVWITE